MINKIIRLIFERNIFSFSLIKRKLINNSHWYFLTFFDKILINLYLIIIIWTPLFIPFLIIISCFWNIQYFIIINIIYITKLTLYTRIILIHYISIQILLLTMYPMHRFILFFIIQLLLFDLIIILWHMRRTFLRNILKFYLRWIFYRCQWSFTWYFP